MPFAELMNDKIDLLKKNGAEHRGLKAVVSTKGIMLDAGNLLIEPGDLIQRNMSNGGKETYEVLDPSFYEGFSGIPAHYQLKVRKLGIPEAAKAIQHITYNVSGNNTRINQNSIDNSTNVVNMHLQTLDLVKQLRNEIACLDLSQESKKEATEIIDAIQAQVEAGKAKKSIIAALLNALPTAANIATIGATLMSIIEATK